MKKGSTWPEESIGIKKHEMSAEGQGRLVQHYCTVSDDSFQFYGLLKPAHFLDGRLKHFLVLSHVFLLVNFLFVHVRMNLHACM